MYHSRPTALSFAGSGSTVADARLVVTIGELIDPPAARALARLLFQPHTDREPLEQPGLPEPAKTERAAWGGRAMRPRLPFSRDSGRREAPEAKTSPRRPQTTLSAGRPTSST